MKSYSEFYKNSGVDITAGYEAVSLMKSHIGRTMTKGVLGGIGGFGGLFQLDLSHIKEPVLVSGTDGVGTKLKIAFLMNKHDTIGIDCVAMCVNDIICSGASPLIFLDYLAVGVNRPEKVAAIVSGVAEGCVQAGCALVGGETAEMPGFYSGEDYDLAGFAVGIVDKSKIIDSREVRPGDAIIGLPSSGLHSNGFSLVRKILDVENRPLSCYVEELSSTLGEALLTPTQIYVKPVLSLLSQVEVKGICHITGGGFFENIPRALPENCSAKINSGPLTIPPIFSLLQREGNIPLREMFNVFNMGTGMCLIVASEDADKAIRLLNESGSEGSSPSTTPSFPGAASVIGEIVPGEKEVILC